MTSSMPWKRAPSCATGPHVARMQLLYCLRSGRIRQTPASGQMEHHRTGVVWGIHQGWTGMTAPSAVRRLAGRLRKALSKLPDFPHLKKNARDREHFGGVPVSKRIGTRKFGPRPRSVSRTLGCSFGVSSGRWMTAGVSGRGKQEVWHSGFKYPVFRSVKVKQTFKMPDVLVLR